MIFQYHIIKKLRIVFLLSVLLFLFSSFRYRNSEPINELIEAADLVVIATVSNPDKICYTDDYDTLHLISNYSSAQLKVVNVLKGHTNKKTIILSSRSPNIRDKSTVLIFLNKGETGTYYILDYLNFLYLQSEKDKLDVQNIFNHYQKIKKGKEKLEEKEVCSFLHYCLYFEISRNSASEEFFFNRELTSQLLKKQKKKIVHLLLESKIEDWSIQLLSTIDVYKYPELSTKLIKAMKLGDNSRMKYCMEVFLQEEGKHSKLEYFYNEFKNYKSQLYKHEMIESFAKEVNRILEKQ